MHTYSDNCDCASCDAFRSFRSDWLDGDLIPEEVELEEVPCSRCGVSHVDTYKLVFPVCLDCEKDMVPVR